MSNPSELGVISRIYKSFQEASTAARGLSYVCSVASTVKRSNGNFLVEAPASVGEIDVAGLFFVYFNRDLDLAVLKFIDQGQFKDPLFTWTDSVSGLTWDTGRVFCKDPTDTPCFKTYALNAVSYGGHNDWRMPTIDDLRTLLYVGGDGKSKLKKEISSVIKGHCLWSDLPSEDDGVFFDYELGMQMSQHYREQRANLSTRGDGYVYSAKSVVVRG